MGLNDWLDRPGAWLESDPKAGIVVSSRIRLARNLEGLAFPGWAGEDECVRIMERIWPCLMEAPSLRPAIGLPMADVAAMDRDFLRERHLISQDLARKAKGSGVVVREDESLSVMVNEEDHMRLQAMRPGFRLPELWVAVTTLDNELESRLPYAFSPTLGYLTACPTNVGTGLRASVMVHVPGLRLMNEMEPIVKGLTKIGLAVRGLQGEGTEASGNMYQISNQVTLGESEPVIIERLTQIVNEVVEHESNARARLLESRRTQVEDFVGRAYGVLCHARILASHEALDMLSALRLGCELDMLRNIDVAEVNRLILYTLPGHLQKREQRFVQPDERDWMRALMVRETVRRAVLALS